MSLAKGAAVLLAASLLLASSVTSAAPVYRITDLGDLAGLGAAALDLNEYGQATGTSSVSAPVGHAFLYSGGSMIDLGVATPFDRSQGAAINDLGVVVGNVLSLQGDVARAAIFNGSSIEVLGTFGGATSYAKGINNGGQVTGSARTVDGTSHAFIYSNGVMTDLRVPYGHSSSGEDINDAGQIAGTFASGANGTGGFLYDGSSMVDLSALGARSAAGINNSGRVTGQTYGNTAYLYEGGMFISLGTLGGSRSGGIEVNDRGQVVGGSNLAGDTIQHAFLFSEGQMYDLNDLLAPGEPLGWTLSVAYGINEHGQIAGVGFHRGETRAFILNLQSVPEPSALALTGTALLLLCWHARRRSARAARMPSSS